jgi:GNAT superfamily N-acetyltransferase
MVTYELLQPADYEQFNSFYQEHFGITPRSNAQYLVAREGLNIIGCLGLYNVVVVDSMAVAPGYRHQGLWRGLIDAVMALPWAPGSAVHFLAANGRENAIGKKLRLDRVLVNVWRKIF